MNGRDPLRDLQAAARAAAEHIVPGHPARRVIVLGEDNVRLLDAAVPLCPCAPGKGAEPEASPGWVVTDRGATFDGQPVKVAVSRLKLLRALAESEVPLTAKDLTAAAFDRATSVENTRFHIRELRRELKAAFTFDGDVIAGDDEGYRLVLR